MIELLAEVSELEQADLITSLAQQGGQKANFLNNLSGSLDYIIAHRQRSQLRQTAQSLRNGQSDLSDEQIKQMLQQVQSQLQVQNQRNPGVHV